MFLLGEEQFLFIEVQSTEQMLCRPWEKLTEEEKSPPHRSGRAGPAGLPDHMGRAPASERALGTVKKPIGSHLFTVRLAGTGLCTECHPAIRLMPCAGKRERM